MSPFKKYLKSRTLSNVAIGCPIFSNPKPRIIYLGWYYLKFLRNAWLPTLLLILIVPVDVGLLLHSCPFRAFSQHLTLGLFLLQKVNLKVRKFKTGRRLFMPFNNVFSEPYNKNDIWIHKKTAVCSTVVGFLKFNTYLFLGCNFCYIPTRN